MRLSVLAVLTVFALFPAGLSADRLYSARHGRQLYFEGRADADPSVSNETQRRALSKDAATADALKKIALYIDGLRLKGGGTVGKAKETDGRIRTKIDAFIQGAEAVRTRWDDSGGCRVTLRIDRKSLLKSLNATEAMRSGR